MQKVFYRFGFGLVRPALYLCLACLVSAAGPAFAAAGADLVAGRVIPLWPDGAPGARGDRPEDVPTLTVFVPDSVAATGASMVILPGGGYHHLADHEGAGFARWLTQQGVTCFVVKYRLASHGYRHPAMLQDAARALRLVRASAPAWQLDPTRIGIMGSSAGGHLASTLLTHFDAGDADAVDPVERVSSRPDLGILCYPVISMGENTHAGSRRGLLGNEPNPVLVEHLSNELQVTADTPPCFLWHTWEDSVVKVENSLSFAAALRRHQVPFDLHVYQHGGHGLGLGNRGGDESDLHPWAHDCLFWLNARGFVKTRN